MKQPSPRDPKALDIEIGVRIRARRKEIGATQGDLAEAVETTFQQVQKYETGRSRVAASRLVEIARYLGVAPLWLLLGEDPKILPKKKKPGASDTGPHCNRQS